MENQLVVTFENSEDGPFMSIEGGVKPELDSLAAGDIEFDNLSNAAKAGVICLGALNQFISGSEEEGSDEDE